MFEYLENLLKTEISENIEIKKAFLRTEEIENYVSVWKLKKPSEISFKAGSCLLLKVNKEDVGKLMKLQSEGIGERRNEGFGQIVFGLQQSEGYYEKLAAEKIIAARPEKESPLLVKTMALSLAEEYLQKVVTVIALNLVKENTKGLDKKISSSQIGRMEGIVRVSNSYSGFVSKINGLRKTSKDKLTSCRFDKSNLLLFLTEVRFLDQIQIKNALLVVDSLFDQVGIDKSKSTSIQEKLFKWYYLTLFSAMRKAIKKEGKNNE
jgi:CRISPR-associated protein Csx10